VGAAEGAGLDVGGAAVAFGDGAHDGQANSGAAPVAGAGVIEAASLVVGALAGLYPAGRASRLAPADAVRSG
jgi:putative ABC transport system permease protein